MCINCCSGTPTRCCSWCVDNLRRGGNHPYHRGYDPNWHFIELAIYEDITTMLKKPPKTGSGHAAPNDYSDPEFKAQFPTLYEYLVSTVYEDGSKRIPATLLCFLHQGLMKVCLHDRDVMRQAFASARTFNEALSMLDDDLREDSIEWRPTKGSKRI